ncbi:MAG: hypothetical protein ABI132_06355 [Rhodanobacteraceae bacterium]
MDSRGGCGGDVLAEFVAGIALTFAFIHERENQKADILVCGLLVRSSVIAKIKKRTSMIRTFQTIKV